MPTLSLAGVEYDYLASKLEGAPEDVHSWEYGKWPKIEAAVPLTAGGSVHVYGEASRWDREQIDVSWRDDAGQNHSA